MPCKYRHIKQAGYTEASGPSSISVHFQTLREVYREATIETENLILRALKYDLYVALYMWIRYTELY